MWMMKNLNPKEKVAFLGIAILIVSLYLWHNHGLALKTQPIHDCEGKASQLIAVTIDDNGFQPAKITANLCDRLRLTNGSQALRQPAADPHPTHSSFPELDPKRPLQPGEAFEVILNRPGRYGWHDHLNPGLKGQIVIEES